MNTEKTIHKILKKITDPLTGLTLSELPVNPRLEIEDTQLSLNLTCGFPSQLLAKQCTPLLQKELEKKFPQHTISITFDAFIKAHQTQIPGKGLRGVKNVIAIASGKGGVGKSTVAVNLATSLSLAGAKVGILDADIYGPSIPLMLGHPHSVAVKDEQYIPVQTHGLQAMSIGYLTQSDSALIWRGPMLAKSLLQMINITLWDDLDYLLIDLPPGTGDIQLSLVQKIPLTAAVVVTTPQTVATLDAQKAIQMFEKTNICVLGLIENMATHQCTKCGHEETIFGEGGAKKVAKKFKLPLLGQLPLQAQIALDSDHGTPSALSKNLTLSQPFLKAALNVAKELAKKPLNYAEKFPPIKVE